MMTCGPPVGQFDLGADRAPVDDGGHDRPLLSCASAALIGLAVGWMFLLVMPRVPGVVRSLWCVDATGGACTPTGVTGRLFDLVVWGLVLAAAATVVTVALGWLAFAVAGVRVTLALTLSGPPLVWSLVVLGEPPGVPSRLAHTPFVLVETIAGYVLAVVLTAPWLRVRWRWSAVVALLLATAVVIVMGYPFD
jgi:hypothetical protein